MLSLKIRSIPGHRALGLQNTVCIPRIKLGSFLFFVCLRSGTGNHFRYIPEYRILSNSSYILLEVLTYLFLAYLS